MRYVVLVLGLASAIAVGARAAASAARPFELVVAGWHEAVPPSLAFPLGIRNTGTFTSGAPFCSSGTFVDLSNDDQNGNEDSRLYACDDGSGTLTVAQEMWAEHKFPFTDTWRIIGGTGRYTGLRGRGTYQGEFLSGDPEDPLTVVFRNTLSGVADFDTVPPTIAVSSAKVAKLKRPAETYSIRLTLMMRDNEPGNAVSYTVAIEPGGGGPYLAEKKGSAAPGKVTMALRIRPARSARTVLLQLGAQDPVGNSGWATRRLKLPR